MNTADSDRIAYDNPAALCGVIGGYERSRSKWMDAMNPDPPAWISQYVKDADRLRRVSTTLMPCSAFRVRCYGHCPGAYWQDSCTSIPRAEDAINVLKANPRDLNL